MPLSPSLSTLIPFTLGGHPIWLASSVSARRNLHRHKFPGKLTESQSKAIETSLRDLISPLLDTPHHTPTETLDPLDRELLLERCLCTEIIPAPTPGQSFLTDASGRWLIALNMNNHLLLQTIGGGNDLEQLWGQLAKFEASLMKSVEPAFSPRFGYLAAKPSQSGTALTATAYLHLPALLRSGEFRDLVPKLKDDEIVTEGLEGSLDEPVGDLILLRNRYTLGVTEENILHAVRKAAMRWMGAETASTVRLQKIPRADVTDQISRAFGLLLHSYQLQTKETINALSLLKLGLSLGMISGITPQQIHALFFLCRRPHLAKLAKVPSTDPQELAHERAAFLHKELKNALLKETT